MKNNLIFIILLGLWPFLNCGVKSKPSYSVNLPKKNIHFLDGLKKLSDTVETVPVDTKKDPINFYTPDGILIPPIEIAKQSYSGNYSVDAYANQKNIIKVVVVRMLSEQKKKHVTMMQFSKGKPNPLLNKKAISFTGTDLKNETFTEAQDGKIIVMNFWFIGCKPCVKELPELNKLTEKYAEEEVVFLSFATDKKEKLVPFLWQHPFKYHVIPENGEISRKYLVLGCPTHIIIDKKSTIRYYYMGGFDSTTIKDFEKEIDKLLVK